MRVNAATGAPLLSGPKLGKPCAYFPAAIADTANNSTEVTAP